MGLGKPLAGAVFLLAALRFITGGAYYLGGAELLAECRRDQRARGAPDHVVIVMWCGVCLVSTAERVWAAVISARWVSA